MGCGILGRNNELLGFKASEELVLIDKGYSVPGEGT